MTAIDQATPEKSQEAIMEQLQKMIGNLDAIPSSLLSTVREREKVAESVHDDVIKHAIKPKSKNEKVTPN